MTQYILSFKNKMATSGTKAGGKGASLARLYQRGYNVPKGFVITPKVFFDFLQAFGIAVLIERKEWIQRDVQHIQEMLIACRIPDKLARPIVDAYHQLGGKVAVRSSMVGEDTDRASFAGQLDSILNVKGERALLRAIKVCWASLFNWRLLNYLSERENRSSGDLLGAFSIAVVVQQMVDARAAGVAFSADPASGQRCIIIEAVRGLGEALVGGRAEPDRYLVDARGILANVEAVNPEAPVLSNDQVLQLAKLVRAVAVRFVEPQDVEWAWDGTEFHLLQCRPITSLVGQRIYSNSMVSDMSPGLVKPLVYTTKTIGMAKNVFGRMFTELIGPCEADFASLIKCIHSRIYTDITLLGELFEQVGMPANFFQMISRDEQSDSKRPPFTLKTLRAALRLGRFAWRHSRPAPEINDFLERHHQALESYRQATWTFETPQVLLARFDSLMHLHGETQWFIMIGPMNMMVRNRLLNRFVRRHAKEIVPSDLIRGLVGLKALEPNDELRKLAAQVGALAPATQRLLIEGSDQTIRAELSESNAGQALLQAVDAFLKRYGFLSTNGTDFTGTPWLENPTLIWRAIGRLAANSTESQSERVGAIRNNARKRVRDRLGWPQRQFFDRLLDSTITYIDLREQTSFLMSEEAYQMRRIFLALADRLIARGDLTRRDDIFYLTYDELRQLVEGDLGAKAAQEKIADQKAKMEADAQIELPDTICGDHVPTRPIQTLEEQEYLVGISGSSGVARGLARVILDPAEAPVALGRDDILVVPFTDVGWTPLFSGIGGVVAETGGQLSHTSIVAREYGLPAVVSVRQATHLIRDGQSITVDGDRGRVYLKQLAGS